MLSRQRRYVLIRRGDRFVSRWRGIWIRQRAAYYRRLYASLARGEISAQDAILIALYRIRLRHTVVVFEM